MRTLAVVMHLCILLPIPPGLPKAHPDINGPCAYGVIEQRANRVTIRGHDTWTATGERREDGSIRLQWLNLHDGRTATGVYFRRLGGQIDGVWGWSADVTDDECGGLFGPTQSEVIKHKDEN